MQETFSCDSCGEAPDRDEVVRRKTIADLDPTKWQTFCCPSCGKRIKTVLVALEEIE